MIRLEMKNYNREKLPKYQSYHQAKLISMSILPMKKKLPSNQKQIIEQSKFTYSLLGKAFEKQIKATEDQGKKQVDALKDLKNNKQKQAKAIEDKSDDKPSMQEKKFNRLLDERMDEIQKIGKEFDLSNLTYYFESSNIAQINFIRFRGPLHVFEEMKNGNLLIEKMKKEKENFKSNLGEITSGNIN